MRILHLISQRPDSTGSGIYLQELLKASVRSGNDNRLVAGIQAGQLPDTLPIPETDTTFVTFESSALPMPIVGMSDDMPYASSRFRDLSREDIALYENRFACTIAPLISSFRPDIIHSHHLWLLSSLTARIFPRIALVTTCHGSDLRQFRSCPHLRDRVLSGCRHIRSILALSKAQKEEIASLYRLPADRITVVGGGCNSRLFYLEKKAALPPVRLIYAGKLSNAKGVPWLLQALQQLDDAGYHLDLAGGGDGPEYEACLTLAAKLGARVTVHGSIAQEQLAALMRQAHIMVLPSLFEGLPLIMLEALAAGCRVIATDLPGTREIAERLHSSPVTLVPCPHLHQVDRIRAQDEPVFVAGLKRALADTFSSLRTPALSPLPLADDLAYFSWEQVFARTQAVYRQLTAHEK